MIRRNKSLIKNGSSESFDPTRTRKPANEDIIHDLEESSNKVEVVNPIDIPLMSNNKSFDLRNSPELDDKNLAAG